MPSLNNNDIIMDIRNIKHDILDMESVRNNNERGNTEKVLPRNRYNYKKMKILLMAMYI